MAFFAFFTMAEYSEWASLLKSLTSTLAVGAGRLPQRPGVVHLSNSSAGVPT